MIYDDEGSHVEPLPVPTVPRAEVIDELCNAVARDRPPLHDGEWAMAKLEVCLGMLESSRTGREVMLHHQVAVPVQPSV